MSRIVWILLLAGAGVAQAQLSSSAYRVLGQADFTFNGLNRVQGLELYGPTSLVLDSRDGQTRLYIADTGNSRVLAWENAVSYQIGDPPALVLGQAGPQYSSVLGIGAKGFAGLTGIAVDPTTGNVYAADTPNNRILRYLSPFDNPSREPDAVYGQSSFTARAAGTSATGLNQPRALAFDSAGNLWIADTGNHRVLRYPAATLNTPGQAAADVVVGQKDLVSGRANGGGQVSSIGLDTPTALAFDAHDNLYVSDFNNVRVLRFTGPFAAGASNAAATTVWGQTSFTSRTLPPQPTAYSIAGPIGLTVDANGNLYVAVPHDNRVLVFPSGAAANGSASSVFGQASFSNASANAGAAPLASASSLSSPTDVKLDASGNVYICDSGNHRVLQYPAGTKSATRVWGQIDFASNSPNQVKPGSFAYPDRIAVDYSADPFALYVSDTANNRVLVWKDASRFRTGAPADLVIGQATLYTGAPNVDSPDPAKPTRSSLFAPEGLAVTNDGTLYVADSGNHRVLRYPRPVAQGGPILPDAVIGQTDFTSAASAVVSAASLRNPADVAIAPNGDLFVADGGNHRVLEYSAGAGNSAAAIRVYGQPSMTSSTKPTQVSAQTLNAPQGIAVDIVSNLYVADSGSNRVLIFSNTSGGPVSGMPASFVIGQQAFSASAAGALRTPVDVAVDSAGNIYVADRDNNRVLIYRSLLFLPASGATASGVIGQQTTSGTAPNYNSTDGLATASGLSAPLGLFLDRQDTLYVADAGNSRVSHFLKAGAVVNAATFQASVPVAQGALATFFGSGLAGDSGAATTQTWPTAMLNRQLVINDDVAAPLYYVGPGQLNFQMPSTTPLGAQRLAVRLADTGELLAGGSVLIGAASPGIFTMNQSGSGQAAALNQDGSINGPNNPATAGSTVVLYGTGQGQVSPAVPDGNAAPGSPLAQTVAVPTSNGTTCLTSQLSMCVAVGATGFGAVQYSGLAPGYVGLWQINVTIPPGTPAGNVPVKVVINGTTSNIVTIAVR